MNVTIESMPELRVATVPHVGPYNRIGEAFHRLDSLLNELVRPGAILLAIFYDDPEETAAESLQSDAGVTIAEGVSLPEGLAEKRLPAGGYARTTHVGPYTTLGDAWSRLMGEWLPKSGKRVGPGWSYEVFRNTPKNTAPDELRTELYLPVL